MSENTNLAFEPNISLVSISQRKFKQVIGWLVRLGLILFLLLGLIDLFNYLTNNYTVADQRPTIFYISLIAGMLLIYMANRRKERTKLIGVIEPGQPIEISDYLDKPARSSLERAWILAMRNGFKRLRPIHFFVVLIRTKAFDRVLKRLSCEASEIIEKTERVLAKSEFFPDKSENAIVTSPDLAADIRNVFFTAYLFAISQNKKQIGVLDVLWAISQEKNLVGMIFDEMGIGPDEIKRTIQWAMLEQSIEQKKRKYRWSRIFKPKGKLDRAMLASQTPILDKISVDLTRQAREGEFEMILGRDKEIETVFQMFSSGKTGVVLRGQSEIGKKSILKKIAQMMVEEQVPDFLKDKRLVELDLGALVGLSEQENKAEHYLNRVIYEVGRAKNILLAIDNIDSLVGLKSQAAGIDFSEMIASAVSSQTFYIIATTTDMGYASKIEGSILGRSLQLVDVPVPDRDLLFEIIASKINAIEQKLEIVFSVDALEKAIDLADRYIYGKALPSKVLDLLSEAAYKAKSKDEGGYVREQDIIALISDKTKVPIGQVSETEKEKLLRLEDLIHQRLVDQEEAVDAVASAMRRSRLESESGEKPVANFLFVGPTGVGKTELAKTLARVYFGDQSRMIRLDMSEYQEKRGLRRLIGLRSDQGLEKGYLTESVKRQPHLLLLLDEIEKAHPDILNLFLQVMDDGRLTDASGETINFTNIILIATSNAGTQFIQDKISQEYRYEEIYKQLKEKVLLEYFRPEFLNRFDKIALFKPLAMNDVVAIARIFLQGLRSKLEKKGVFLEVANSAIIELAQLGYDPLYGARPLKRVIQEKVEDPIATLFLKDQVSRRDTVTVKKGLLIEVTKGIKL